MPGESVNIPDLQQEHYTRYEEKKSDENVLSEVKYQHQVYIGKKDGLFIKGKQKNEWIEIFPSDRNYSWKLSNVNVLQVDSRDRLWFGSNEGAGYFHNGQWNLFTGKEGLPFNTLHVSQMYRMERFGLVPGKVQSEQMEQSFTIASAEDGFPMTR